MNIRIYNARILTMEEGRGIFEGEIHVKGNRISYVGETLITFTDETWDREIDAKGNVIMPGFKNAHTHSAMTFLRSYADDLPLLDWLNEQVFPMEAKLTPEDIYSYFECHLENKTKTLSNLCYKISIAWIQKLSIQNTEQKD